MCAARIGEAKELHCFKRSDAIICAAVGAKNTQASEEFLLMMQYPLVLFVFKQKKMSVFTHSESFAFARGRWQHDVAAAELRMNLTGEIEYSFIVRMGSELTSDRKWYSYVSGHWLNPAI